MDPVTLNGGAHIDLLDVLQTTLENQCVMSVAASGDMLEGAEAWAKFMNRPLAEVTGKRWLQMLSDHPAKRIIGKLAAEKREHFENRLALDGDGRPRIVSLRFAPAGNDADSPWIVLATDLTDTTWQHSITSFLLRLSELFASTGDEREIMKKLAAFAVPEFADWCTAHLFREDGTIENVAVTFGEAADAQTAPKLERFSLLAPDAPLNNAFRTGVVQLHSPASEEFLTEHVAVNPADGAFLLSLGVSSIIVAPVIVRSQTVGAVRFMTRGTERLYGPFEAEVASDVAKRAALAIDNARSRAEAAASSHSKDIFLATLSHEMKTPLTSILGWTRILRADGAGSDLFEEAVSAIEKSAQVQQRLIEDLLDVSRVITGKLHLELARIDLRALVESTVEMLLPRAKENFLHIRVTAPTDLSVTADATRLQQVLWNLVTNAMKFTPKGGLIEISADRDGEEVVLSVRDTGRGIHEHALPHIFDRFHQASIADRAEHGGLGLGLAIVRNVVELHGGRVEAFSDGHGKGSTFTVRIPDDAPLPRVVNTERVSSSLAG